MRLVAKKELENRMYSDNELYLLKVQAKEEIASQFYNMLDSLIQEISKINPITGKKELYFIINIE